MKPVYISREGRKKLYEDYLAVDDEIAKIHKQMGESAQMDRDLMENSEYMSLRVEAMYNLPNKKRELFEKYNKAIIIEDTDEYKNFDGKTVIRGSEVSITFGGDEETFIILGTCEGDAEKGIISCDAPLAELLLKKQVGDRTEFNGEEIYIISVTRV